MCENIYIDIYRYKIIFTYILHSTEPSWLQKGQRNFVAKNTFFFVTTFFCFFLLLPIFVSYTCYNVLLLLSYCSVLFPVYIRLYIVFRDDIKFINIYWWCTILTFLTCHPQVKVAQHIMCFSKTTILMLSTLYLLLWSMSCCVVLFNIEVMLCTYYCLSFLLRHPAFFFVSLLLSLWRFLYYIDS